MADLHRTNIHLYTSDVVFLVNHFGYGWTGHVRELVRREVARIRDQRHSNKLTHLHDQPRGVKVPTIMQFESSPPVDLRPFDLDRLIQEQDQ